MNSETLASLRRATYSLVRAVEPPVDSDTGIAAYVASIITEAIHSDLWPAVMRRMSDERLELLHDAAWAEQERRSPAPPTAVADQSEAAYREEIDRAVRTHEGADDLEERLTTLGQRYSLAHSGAEASGIMVRVLAEQIAELSETSI